MSTDEETRLVRRFALLLFFQVLSLSVTVPGLAQSVLHLYHGDQAAAASFSSTLYIVPPILQFLSNPVFGIMSDRGYGRKPFLYMAVIGVLASKVVLAISLTATALWIATIVRGCLDGGVTLVSASLVDVSSSHKAYTRNFGTLGMAIGIAFVLGPGVGAGLGAASAYAAHYRVCY